MPVILEEFTGAPLQRAVCSACMHVNDHVSHVAQPTSTLDVVAACFRLEFGKCKQPLPRAVELRVSRLMLGWRTQV